MKAMPNTLPTLPFVNETFLCQPFFTALLCQSRLHPMMHACRLNRFTVKLYSQSFTMFYMLEAYSLFAWIRI